MAAFHAMTLTSSCIRRPRNTQYRQCEGLGAGDTRRILQLYDKRPYLAAILNDLGGTPAFRNGHSNNFLGSKLSTLTLPQRGLIFFLFYFLVVDALSTNDLL